MVHRYLLTRQLSMTRSSTYTLSWPRTIIVCANGALSETLWIQNSVTIERFDNFVEYERLCGSKARVAEVPCAHVVSLHYGRDRLRSRVRSTLSPWHDRRNAFDK